MKPVKLTKVFGCTSQFVILDITYVCIFHCV